MRDAAGSCERKNTKDGRQRKLVSFLCQPSFLITGSWAAASRSAYSHSLSEMHWSLRNVHSPQTHNEPNTGSDATWSGSDGADWTAAPAWSWHSFPITGIRAGHLSDPEAG